MLIKELTELNGVSGNEDEVRKFIKAEAEKYADSITEDSMGNLICYKKGMSSKYRVMLSAHMDEVGFMVTGYEDGLLKFASIGGIDERILPGKRVLVGDKRIPGVIGSKPIHLQEKIERGNNIKQKNMYIDIGAEKKEEAEKLAPLGEYIAFHSPYTEFGDGCIKAKALDDRIGCAILLEILKETYRFDLYVCFTVQEEIGLRGAGIAAFRVNPDIAIVVEGTTCSDVPGAREHEYSTVMGQGAALTVMDRTSYPNKRLVEFMYKTAIDKNIPVQYKQTTTGGNDAGKIQLTREGVVVASVSVPCRYIHSPVSVMNRRDYESCLKLVKAVLDEMGSNENLIESFKA
ncbi:M42 family metallopeptidase [Acetivibrio straminisolvens]|uniref:Deblocking aminopeptidase n=1 Tax=Acetivibrio straminisolvens JCM 21531 TaxID=1294263 RepID=W4V262_9FIRM|nr:M42 family metallopeptidase [Acetivibrio straminisolvens]GAE86898.1 deblocking aminopeptidase [Acetivibrio straminisolvens JCM 21531]